VIAVPKSADRWLTRAQFTIGPIKDIEHFRTEAKSLNYFHGQLVADWNTVHVAVVVSKRGECFVGKAKCHERDNYNHKLGYRIAVGRALKAAAEGKPDFMVDLELEKKELFLAVRETYHAHAR